ncbi:MAG: hypothetical protein AAFX50_08660, partial [Acidobacteriota bacterium]
MPGPQLLLLELSDASGRAGAFARAAFLHEIATSWDGTIPADAGHGSSEPSLAEPWRAAMRVSEDHWYDLRLAHDGLDPASFERLLAHIKALEENGRAWPAVDFETDFVPQIDDIIEDRFHSEVLPRFGSAKDPSDAPFFAFIAPMVRTALAHLRRRLAGPEAPSDESASWTRTIPLHKKALARMVDALANRLFAICSPTLVLELNVARVRGELDGEDGPSRAAMFSKVLLADPARRRALFEEYQAGEHLVFLEEGPAPRGV